MIVQFLILIGAIAWIIYCVWAIFGPMTVQCTTCEQQVEVRDDGWLSWKCPHCGATGKVAVTL